MARETLVVDLMTESPFCVAPTDPVSKAQALLVQHAIRHLPVEERGSLVGIISVRDLLPAEDDLAVGDVMSHDVFVIRQNVTASDAADRMLRYQVSCLPVVDRAQLMVGILTTTDILAWVTGRLAESDSTGRFVSVGELMTARPLITVVPSTSLAEAYLVMRAGHVHHLAVLDGERVVGVLFDLELLAVGRGWLSEVSAGGSADHGALRVADVLSIRTQVFAPRDLAGDAGRYLCETRVDCIPVEEDQRLAGMLTVTDFLRYGALDPRGESGPGVAAAEK